MPPTTSTGSQAQNALLRDEWSGSSEGACAETAAGDESGEREPLRPRLSRIRIFPIKSLDGLDVARVRVLPSGALENDRMWALFDDSGGYVNGKRHAAVHRLRSRIDLATGTLSLRDGSREAGDAEVFNIDRQREALERWLGEYFGFGVGIREDLQQGFPDDMESPGPTIISAATLREIGKWFGLPIEDVRNRFRTNLEIDGVPPFWEDKLFAAAGTTVRFRIGNVIFDGINPCQRCVVPPRDACSGVGDDTFVRRFAELRERTLPAWSTRARFNHFYRVAINTRLNSLDGGDEIRLGDEVEILDAPARTTAIGVSASASVPSFWAGELIVEAVRDETPTVKTFRLRSLEENSLLPFKFLPGQFLVVTVGTEVGALQRCYTIASAPSAADYAEITVKREGKVSSILHETLAPESRLSVSGPLGQFTFAGDEAADLVMIAGGVGITPLMSKLRHLANSGWPGRIDLFYSVKSGRDVIFAAELAKIERKFPNVRVHVTVTSDPSWVGRKGRLSDDWISQCVPDISNRLIHLCGPTAMAAASQRLLRGLGVSDGRIKTEAFGGQPSQSFGDVGEHEVRFAVSDISVTAPAGRTILDVALAAGLSLDHGCRAGVCGRCRKKLVAGSVTIDSDFVLTADQKAQGLILTCQTRPTEAVTIEC